jgi:hypothetical protein
MCVTLASMVTGDEGCDAVGDGGADLVDVSISYTGADAGAVSADPDLVHDLGELGLVVDLARREHDGERRGGCLFAEFVAMAHGRITRR